MTNDELLDRYVNESAESAFSTLVGRHLNLVYSTALRLVRSPQLAEEVAQSVFIDLARHGGRIKPGTPLVAWLHMVARRTAVDAVRREMRRRTRDSEVAQVLSADQTVPLETSPWTAIESLLDEAVDSLHPGDRAAILLRFFENKSLREVGHALGTSDDAAQKRVSRALDQLRTFFVRRGAIMSSGELATNLSAHALCSAPSPLSFSIVSALASKVSGTLALSRSIHALTMTTTQKILTATVLALTVGGGFYEAHLISQKNRELQSLRQQSQTDQRTLRMLRDQRDAATRTAATLSEQLASERAKTAGFASQDPVAEKALDAWLQKVVRLKAKLKELPELQIPELQFLESKDWLDATKEGTLDNEWDFRAALSGLRQSAKGRFVMQLRPALDRYLKANNHQRPIDPAQLAPYLEKPVDAAIWQRYKLVARNEAGPDVMLPAKTADGNPVTWLITEKDSVDDYYDSTFYLSEAGWGFDFRAKYGRELDEAITAFMSAHDNKRPTETAQIRPYLRSTIDPSFVERSLKERH